MFPNTVEGRENCLKRGTKRSITQRARVVNNS